MKKLSLISSIVLSFLMFSASCKKESSEYENIEIGTQTWMTKNLDVDKFRNGDVIPHAQNVDEWEYAKLNKQPAWCYYDNDPANGKIYGKLYNGHAVNDSRGLAPKGWHIPTDEEWTVLSNYLGGQLVAGAKMKSAGNLYWQDPTVPGTNESGFAGLPGGSNSDFNFFSGMGFYGAWWSSTVKTTNVNWLRELNGVNGSVQRTYLSNTDYLSVRCLKD